ncbi:ribosomal protein L7/L12 [Streptomyces sp. NPDC048551]|uniref:ribosomal protein L7/L12 n=1 Tax=Streptomyces sp. NPDC048551 TaxID=3155758 RepID=UPI00344946EE
MEEPGFRVLLTESGDRKAEAIRAIRAITGLSLWNSKLLLESAPVAVTEPDWLEAAQNAAGALEAAGAHATVLCDCATAPSREGLARLTRPCVAGHGLPRPVERVAHRLRTGYARC